MLALLLVFLVLLVVVLVDPKNRQIGGVFFCVFLNSWAQKCRKY